MYWNNSYAVKDLNSFCSSLEGKTIDVCTVRSSSVASASLGTLFWMLVATNAAQYAKQVNVYDFVTGNKNTDSPSLLPVEELADILQAPSNLAVYRAEEIDKSTAWAQLRYLRTVELIGEVHPQVLSALPKLASESEPADLSRIAEELAVFLSGYDDAQRIQLSAHESETIAIVRNLHLSVQKQYVNIKTGIGGSEFRRYKIPSIERFADRLLVGNNQGANYSEFQTCVLEMLSQRIMGIIDELLPLPDMEAAWLEDARSNGKFLDTNIPYEETIKNEGVLVILQNMSFPSFKNRMTRRHNVRRDEMLVDLARGINLSLVPHILAQGEGEFKSFNHSESMVEFVIDQVLSSAGIVGAAHVDFRYLSKILPLPYGYSASLAKVRALVEDCLVRQKIDPAEAKKYYRN